MAADFNYKLYSELDDKVLNEVFDLEELVFSSPHSKTKFINELATKHNKSIFIAYKDGSPVGYKIGFERSRRIYYSWVGGVDPSFRNSGVAKKLMELQHQHALSLGYKIVCTQTDNSFKPMIILNLKSGFEIKGTIQSTGDNYMTIIMEKEL
jgi:predicted GNAT superfamily acetyltransferase